MEPFDWAKAYPKTPAEELRLLTFRELRKRGFYVTSGDKFGADFLAYPGDPLLFHAKFVVQCVQRKTTSTGGLVDWKDQVEQEDEASLVAR